MVNVGKYNTLKIVKDLDFGVYLDGGDGLEILLPARYVPNDVKPGDDVEVFIYHDNEGRLIATTAKPLAQVGEFQYMEVKSVNEMGAFLEWGLMKDLLVPFREQKLPMCYRITYTYFSRRFDARNNITHIACRHFITRRKFQFQNAHFICIIFLSCSNELDMMGDTEGALDAFLRAELLNPDSRWVIRRIASCYRILKQPEKAIEYYNKLTSRSDETYLSLDLNIGNCLLELKRYDEALKYFFKVDYLDGKNHKACA